MTKKFFAFFMAFTVLLSSSLITVYADGNDGYFSDYDDNDFLDIPNNDVKCISNVLDAVIQIGNGEIHSTEEFVGIVADNAFNCTSANAKAMLNTIADNLDNSTQSVRDVQNYVVNTVRDYISSNGGNVSGFPSGNTTVSAGQGYVVFEPYTAWYVFSDGASRYEIYATVYYNNGTVAVPKKRVYNTNPQKNNILDNGGGILSIYFDRSIDMDSGGTRLFMFSDCYEWGYPNARTVSFAVDVPWTVGDSTVDTTNLTPDVGVLSDDDFCRYIDRLIDNLDNTYPDTSTLDGKLQEIINKMDKLGNGCNCAELASAVYALLDYLQQNGGASADNTDLVNALHELNNTLKHNGNNVDLSDINNKLDKIYKELAGIHDDMSNDDDASDKVKKAGNESILKFSEKLQNKFQLGAVKTTIDNFSSAVFGKRVFSQDDKSGRIMVASVYADGSHSVFSTLTIPVEISLFDKKVTVDLAELCKYIPPGAMSTVKDFISYILWFTFLIGLYRSLPGLLAGVGRVETHNSKLNGG